MEVYYPYRCKDNGFQLYFIDGTLNTYSTFYGTPITLSVTAVISGKHLAALN
jgi:hypothetical protein